MSIGSRLAIAAAILGAASTARGAPNWLKPKLGAPFGVNAHQEIWNAPNPESQELVDLGADWIRVDFNWVTMEPAPGQFDWTVTDGIVANADALGLNVFATLAYTPQWATDGAEVSGVPRDSADWDAFVYATVSRYAGSVKYWGMWNEPNLTQFWSGTRSQYIQGILEVGHGAAKRADPTCFVVGPELARLTSAHWNDWLSDVLTQAGDDIDIISQHEYDDDANGVTNHLDGAQWPWDPPAIRDVITSAGAADKPFWLTETGLTTNNHSEQEQAAFYQGVLDGMLTRRWWNKVFFYEIEDGPGAVDLWGIAREDHSHKPAFDTYAAFIAAHQPVAQVASSLSGVAGEPVAFDGSGSSEAAGGISSYAWDFDDADGVGVDATGATASWIYAQPGDYVATLTVTDQYGYSVFARIAVHVDVPTTTGSTTSSSGTSSSSASSGSSGAGSTGSSGSTSTGGSGSTGGGAGPSTASSSASGTAGTSTAPTSGSGTSAGGVGPSRPATVGVEGGCDASSGLDLLALGALSLVIRRRGSRKSPMR